MANIMINENCNLSCPYCFASEFVNIHKSNISFDNFKKAVAFILSEREDKRKGRIGIIGGEPLLHPQFDEFIDYLASNERVKHITVYTNGVLLEKHLDSILNEKVSLLININSPNNIGEDNYNQTENAIRLLIKEHDKRGRITIGLNIYDNIDYSFFINLANKYAFQKVRLSVVVPAYNKEKPGFTHFVALKESILKITKSLMVNDIRFGFDCNWPVPCMWNEDEIKDLKLMGLCSTERELIPLRDCQCQPVIDILPDLTAIRCFGLSDISKTPIKDFENICDLRAHFYKSFDTILSKKTLRDSCEKCDLFPNRCYGGCLSNRPINLLSI